MLALDNIFIFKKYLGIMHIQNMLMIYGLLRLIIENIIINRFLSWFDKNRKIRGFVTDPYASTATTHNIIFNRESGSITLIFLFRKYSVHPLNIRGNILIKKITKVI